MNDDLLALQQFNGVARLFPLPNLVLFPFAVQGLHIFEPRYRQMTTDALADDRLMALALLKPGWESEYEGWPELYPVACLGRIVADERLEDGRFNLQVRGVSRVRIVEELKSAKLYRSARVELLTDTNLPAGYEEQQMRRRLRKAVAPYVPTDEPGRGAFLRLLQSDVAVGMISDILAYALPLETEVKQELLETLDVGQRLELLCRTLRSSAEKVAESKVKFPPDFSMN